jgi:hypothetical protein
VDAELFYERTKENLIMAAKKKATKKKATKKKATKKKAKKK